MSATNLPLDGIRVLDLGDRASTAWCGRLCGDYGADVIGIESPDGHPLRREGPFDGEGRSVPAAYLLVNRRLGVPGDRERLVAEADLILTSAATGDEELGAEALAAKNPAALVCSITAYGLSGALSGRPGNDLTACAHSGWAFVNGRADREPLKCSGYQASYQSGTFAFAVAVAALLERLASGEGGQIIDISEREVLVSTFSPAPLRYQYSGAVVARRTAVDVNEGPVPVKDGWFALTISRPFFWVRAMELLGLPDLAEDKELQQAGLRHKFKDRFVDRVGAAMATWNRMELFDALGAQRVIAGPVLTMDELAENPQFVGRGFFRSADDGTRYPGPFAAMGRSGWRTPAGATTPAPTATGFLPNGAVEVQPVRAGADGKGPLAGFRGLVLTQAWAGTYATQLLGLLGADVIQVETRGRLDSWRGTYQNPIPKLLKETPTARHSWNCSPLYNSVNLNKRCITVDLSEPEGVELFREFVVHADFVAENFSPRVMGNLGIDYDRLREIKPDLVMASLSAYGARGPWAHVPGIGGTIEPSSGMSALLGYEDEHPMNSGQMYPDPVAGLCGLSAIVLALLQRDRTGEGQYIDLSMQEANFTFIGDAWMEYELTGSTRGTTGNSHSTHAPHGIYPAQGEDRWVALAAETEEQWQRLAQILELPTAGLDDPRARKAEESRLNELIAERTGEWERDALVAEMVAAGIPTAPVLGPAEIAHDSDLRERGFVVAVDHPEAGTAWQAGLPAHLSRTPGGITRHAPLQGQHSFEVFSEFLGMDRATYERLCEDQITGTGPSTKSTVANQA